MKTGSKSNNLVALLIALLLIAIGFALAFIHRQTESREKADKTPVAAVVTATSHHGTAPEGKRAV